MPEGFFFRGEAAFSERRTHGNLQEAIVNLLRKPA